MKKITIVLVASFLLVIAGNIQAQKHLQASITDSTNIFCGGDSTGSAMVTAIQGSPPYTYLWTPGGGTNATHSNLSAGTYTVMVVDYSSVPDTVYCSVTITQPTPLLLRITSHNNVHCLYDTDGSASVETFGGTSSYEYLWSDGNTTTSDSNLRVGSYTVTVIEPNGCSASKVIPINALSVLTAATSSSEVSCFGLFNGSATTKADDGLPPYQYLWTPGGATTDSASGLSAGTYSVLITDALGCAVEDSTGVTEPAPLVLTTAAIDSMAYAYVSGGTAPYTYKWYPNNSTTSIVAGLSEGTYTVTVRDSNKCFDSATVSITSNYFIPQLLLDIGPPTMTCGNPGYITYPIMVNPDNHIFNSCVFGIYYPTCEFLGDSMSNGGITVTRGPDFLPGFLNDYDSLSATNLSDSTLEIRFGSPTDSSPGGTLLSPAVDTLLYIKFKIQSCQPANLQFTNNAYNDTLGTFEGKDSLYLGLDSTMEYTATSYKCHPELCYSTYSYCCLYNTDNTSCLDSCYTIVTDTCYQTCYDTTWYYVTYPVYTPAYSIVLPYSITSYSNNTDLGEACPLTISDFNSPINAGVGDTLTITGANFGSARGNGQVEFYDADTSNYRMQKINNLDYISWANNQIKIRLPGYVDSVHIKLANKITVGGGNFILTNSCGVSVTSGNNSNGDPFSVYYNIYQSWNYSTNQKNEILLRNINGNGGYVLHLNPISFPVGSYKRLLFAKAMRDWTCFIGMNWTIGSDTIIAYNVIYPPSFTGINYIFFTDSLPTGSTLVGQTNSIPSYGCIDSMIVLKEVAMFFNSHMSFVYDSTETIAIPSDSEDFYGTCLHELGHFIGLGHDVIDSDLMYWKASMGPIAAIDRQTLWKATAASAVDGAIYSVKQSVTDSGYCSGYLPMIRANTSCVNITGIKEVQESSNFVIYPNPSQGTFTIEAPVNQYTILVTNMLGQIILSRKIQSGKAEVNISTVANGMYFVQEQYTKGIATQKLIITKK